MWLRINDTRIEEHTASTDGDEVAGLWDDVKDEFENCFVKDKFENCFVRDPCGNCFDDFVPEDGGTYSADFAMEAQPAELFEIASTEGACV